MTLNCDLILDPAWGGILADHAGSGTAVTLAVTGSPGADEGQYGRVRLLTVTRGGVLTATRRPNSTTPHPDEMIAHQIGVSVVSPAAWPYLAGRGLPMP